MMVRILSGLSVLRYLFVPLVLFLCLAILGLVVKSGGYVLNIFLGMFSETAGTLIHYSLALVDIILVIGLLRLIIGHVVYTYTLTSEEVQNDLPEWMLARLGSDDDQGIKLKIAVTVLLIATIDLLGVFISISIMPNEEFADLLASRVWYMLALHLALVVTAVVLIFFSRFAGPRPAPPRDKHDPESG